jgi:hypothetical protein
MSPLVGLCASGLSSPVIAHLAKTRRAIVPFLAATYTSFADIHRLLAPAAGYLPSVALSNQTSVLTGQPPAKHNLILESHNINPDNNLYVDSIFAKEFSRKKKLALTRCQLLADKIAPLAETCGTEVRVIGSDVECFEIALDAAFTKKYDFIHVSLKDDALHASPHHMGLESFCDHNEGKGFYENYTLMNYAQSSLAIWTTSYRISG